MARLGDDPELGVVAIDIAEEDQEVLSERGLVLRLLLVVELSPGTHQVPLSSVYCSSRAVMRIRLNLCTEVVPKQLSAHGLRK